MSYGPTKLGRIWVKQQVAWGTKLTSFADADAIDSQGMFMPAGAAEPLGQPTQRPVFGASDKKAGSRAGATATLTFALTDAGNASAATIEHKLIADALGTIQALSAIGAITAATDDSLSVATGTADQIGQGAVVGFDPAGAARAITFVKDYTDSTPDVYSTVVTPGETPDTGFSVGRTITLALTTGGLASLPFTMQFSTPNANGGFRAWDGRVTSCTITANAKQQVTVALNLQFLDWEYVTGLTAPAFSFPRTQLGPVIKAASIDPVAETASCYSELSIAITQGLAEALCSSSDQGVSQLVTTDRTVVITERSVTDDIYASVTANQNPGTAVAALWRLSSKGAGAGYQVAAYGPALQLQATSKPVDLGGIWGLERILEARNIIASTDGTGGASTVKGTAFRIAFG